MDKQWKHEIAIFFRRLNEGDVMFDNGNIIAPYNKRENDGRVIVWESGTTRLRDDNYSVQHSRELTDRELGRIYRFLARYN